MFFPLEIGLRYLRSPKKQTVSVITFVAVSGVAVGVAALLAVLSITTGFQEEFRNKVLGVNAHVLVMKYGLDFEEYADVIARAREMPEVAGAAPFIINDMLLVHGERRTTVAVKGVDPVLMPTVLDLPRQMTAGSFDGLRRPGAAPPRRPEDDAPPPTDGLDLDAFLRHVARTGERPTEQEVAPPPDEAIEPPVEGDEGAGADDEWIELPPVHVPTPEEAEAALARRAPTDESGEPTDDLWRVDDAEVTPLSELPGLVLGSALATQLAVSVGERVTIVSPLSGLDTSLFRAEMRAPRAREFRVIGLFEAGFEEYDTRLVLIDLYEAQAFYDHGDSVDGVELRLHDIDDAPAIARRLERALGGGPYHTTDWRELNHNLFTALEIQKWMLSLVFATIIFVAAFNVIATLIMIVLEKKREIAILKAMGARDWHVMLVFLVQGMLIGLLGTSIGLALGGGVCTWLEAFHLPLDPHVYLIDHLPLRTSATEFAMTVVIAFFICLVATLVPSWWAARLLPAEGVRYE